MERIDVLVLKRVLQKEVGLGLVTLHSGEWCASTRSYSITIPIYDSTSHLEWQCCQLYAEAKNYSSLVWVFNNKLRDVLNLFYIFMSGCVGDTHPRCSLKYNAWRLAWRGKLMWRRWIESKDPLHEQLEHEVAWEWNELFEVTGVTQKMMHEFTWLGIWGKWWVNAHSSYILKSVYRSIGNTTIQVVWTRQITRIEHIRQYFACHTH